MNLGDSNKMSSLPGETVKKAGRPAKDVQYRDTTIDGCHCVVGTITHNGNPLEFIIDKDDEEKVRSRHWYAITGGKYIGVHVTIEGERKILMLHNFIMNKLDFPGKGAKESVDHINRNGLDNRKSNLRIVSQSMQNVNKKSRGRTAQLPEGISDLPKHVWYIKANGGHGDRFCIELKTKGVTWKTSSSKKLTIHEKLEQAKQKLAELYEEFPHLKQ